MPVPSRSAVCAAAYTACVIAALAACAAAAPSSCAAAAVTVASAIRDFDRKENREGITENL